MPSIDQIAQVIAVGMSFLTIPLFSVGVVTVTPGALLAGWIIFQYGTWAASKLAGLHMDSMVEGGMSAEEYMDRFGGLMGLIDDDLKAYHDEFYD